MVLFGVTAAQDNVLCPMTVKKTDVATMMSSIGLWSPVMKPEAFHYLRGGSGCDTAGCSLVNDFSITCC